MRGPVLTSRAVWQCSCTLAGIALLGVACGDDGVASSGGGGAGGASSTSGSTISSSSTTGSGAGGGGECEGPADCPAAPVCELAVCTAGQCGTAFAPAGSPSADQVTGDCLLAICDGAGATTSEADDSDVPDDGEDCTADSCSDGVPTFSPVAAGSPCGVDLYCNSVGQCVGCLVPEHCGTDTECRSYACVGGVCETVNAPAGAPLAVQVPSDCMADVCDGQGSTTQQVDDSDVPLDGNDCTDDVCTNGVGSNPDTPLGSACAFGFCTGVGVCVECLDAADCPSGICEPDNTCATATCNDNVLNNGESDTDCGGTQCPKCLEGDSCFGPDDCLGGLCLGGVCQPSCTDFAANGDETDVDCGGSCSPCGVGQSCLVPADCASAVCNGACAEYQLLISELWPRGPGGGNDDFVELYNPLTLPVTLPISSAMEKLEIATRAEGSASYSVKWTANGQTIPAHGHLLMAGSAYTRSTTPDDTLLSGFPDEISLVLRRGSTTLDAACINVGTDNFDGTYVCEGSAFTYIGSSNNTDRSLERKPGGAGGNAQDTGSTVDDFQLITPSAPQNLASPATP